MADNDALPDQAESPIGATSAVATGARGRPRDPLLESRVFDAAIALYAEAGWPGFSYEAIARRAGVGKAALYRRWSHRGELLGDTLHARWLRAKEIDTGSLRGDLLELGRVCIAIRTGPHAGTALHMIIDADRSPEAAAAIAPYALATTRYARAIVERAVRRGEVDVDIDVATVIDLLVGGITNHIAGTPAPLRPMMLERLPDYLEALVEVILRGVTGRTDRGATS